MSPEKKAQMQQHYSKSKQRHLYNQREHEIGRLGELRNQRDALNQEVKVISTRINALISEFKGLMARADVEKKARDRENDIVKKLVEEKKIFEHEISVLKKAYIAKQKEMRGLSEFKENPESIQKEIEELEWKQQTEAVSAKKERELSKKINELRARLPKTEKAKTLLKEIQELRAKLREKIEQSRKKSNEINLHLKASDEHHKQRIDCFKKAEVVEQKIRETFRELDAKRGEANAKHAELLAAWSEIRYNEESEEHLKRRTKEAAEAEIRAKISEQAKKLYTEFKAGKKLNMDELLVLQEAGIL